MAARWIIGLSVVVAVQLASCFVGFESGPRGDNATPDASPVDDAAPLPDVVLAPAPSTCMRDDLMCVPAPPAGWSGPIVLYEGAAANAPACAAGTTTVLTAQRLAPVAPAQCGACACNAASGFTCGQVTVEGRNSACFCNGPSNLSLRVNRCEGLSSSEILCDAFQAGAVDFGLSATTGGACAPSAPRPPSTKPALAFAVATVGCQLALPSQVDCPTGNVCAARPTPPFNPKQCVIMAGEAPACPGFPYAKRSVFHRGVNDTRDCGVCACGSPPSATCTTRAKTSEQSDCSDGVLASAPTCQPLGTRRYAFISATPPTNVTCAASGGAPVGTATATDAVTVCCAE